MTQVKICGIKEEETLRAAVGAGADYIGFVFCEDSPRYIDAPNAWNLRREIPGAIKTVGLFVNPTDREISKVLATVQLDMVQLHGEETPLRVIEIKAAYKIPVMKAIRVGNAADIEAAAPYERAADWLLFDAKVDRQAGGTGKSFDWELLRGKTFAKPWMLSGGLNAENVKDALAVLKPDAVDVSSGVESALGVKDPGKIREFIKAVKEMP